MSCSKPSGLPEAVKVKLVDLRFAGHVPYQIIHGRGMIYCSQCNHSWTLTSEVQQCRRDLKPSDF